ncbi:MAG: VIT1/CCC1 transporter family protein [Thermoplasmata archaeon]|nr:VIT1/CCC1 transporter family protein [Thermoplasmata archaeon]
MRLFGRSRGHAETAPHPPEHEPHFTESASVRDFIIGLSDGLTVPFALVAGLAGVLSNNHYIIIGGLAEIVAGTISMGVGGYLAAQHDAEFYRSERAREEKEVELVPEVERKEVREIFEGYGLTPQEAETTTASLTRRKSSWVDFMMLFELGLPRPRPDRLWRSPLTIGGAYAIGGFVPLSPYFLFPVTSTALGVSAVVTLIALFVFGVARGRATDTNPWKSGVQTLVIGGVAALAAYGLARGASGHGF